MDRDALARDPIDDVNHDKVPLAHGQRRSGVASVNKKVVPMLLPRQMSTGGRGRGLVGGSNYIFMVHSAIKTSQNALFRLVWRRGENSNFELFS